MDNSATNFGRIGELKIAQASRRRGLERQDANQSVCGHQGRMTTLSLRDLLDTLYSKWVRENREENFSFELQRPKFIWWKLSIDARQCFSKSEFYFIALWKLYKKKINWFLIILKKKQKKFRIYSLLIFRQIFLLG